MLIITKRVELRDVIYEDDVAIAKFGIEITEVRVLGLLVFMREKVTEMK